jgi:hypothetical protein
MEEKNCRANTQEWEEEAKTERRKRMRKGSYYFTAPTYALTIDESTAPKN